MLRNQRSASICRRLIPRVSFAGCVVLAGSLALSGRTHDAFAESISTLTVQRIYGTDAIGTSIAVSQAEFPTAGSAKTVVLARSDFFSDALAGGPLAAKLGGPLLITPPASVSSTLDPRVLTEIERVLPAGGTVYILGGDAALSPGIDSELEGHGYSTQRVAGSDEYATAIDIAEQLGNPSTVFEATGLDFPDALSAVPAAIEKGGAILLTDGSTQDPETASYLSAHPGDTRYAIGGPLAAYGADPTAIPVYGQDLYGTSAAVAGTFFPTPTVFGAATGSTFSDALSGGVFVGTRSSPGPILLVEPSGPLPSSINTYLVDAAPTLTQGYLFGGPVAVDEGVLSELQSAVTPPLLTSSNWSGYVSTGNSYTSVTGTFTVPNLVSGTPTSDASTYWVGIDGANNTSLIQAGVLEYVDPSNTNLVYIYPWWEILPAGEVEITSVAVSAGDEVTVTIRVVSGDLWGITLTNDTNGESFTTDQVYTGPETSAEWIVEAPSQNGSIVPLAPYTPDVSFTNDEYAGVATGLDRYVIVQNGVQVSTPSVLSGDSFNVAYGSAEPSASAMRPSGESGPQTLVPASPPPGSVPAFRSQSP
jgi:Peptidase A4 family/ell wall binding domain 2 (CWB2)